MIYGIWYLYAKRCREDFRPQAKTRGKQAKWRGAAKAHKGDRKARIGRGPKL